METCKHPAYVREVAAGAAALGLAILLSSCGSQPSAGNPHPPKPTPTTSPHVDTAKFGPAAAATRWPADTHLSEGIARIRLATDALAYAEHEHLNAAQVIALADELDAAASSIIANCKLEPAADEALHPLLARVFAASKALRSKPGSAAPVDELREVLRQYQLIFASSATDGGAREGGENAASGTQSSFGSL